MEQESSNAGTIVLHTDENGFNQAAELLRDGETVAFPTETVYGLGANAMVTEAVDKIFLAKGRPGDNPLIIHIWSTEQLPTIVSDVSSQAQLLMQRFWPGPLTLILPKSAEVPTRTTGGLDTVAVRMPDHPVALRLLQKCGVPIAAPSANRSGKPSPTTAKHVMEDLAGRIAAVLDGGPSGVGVESTVLDLTVSPPAILRPGAITREEIAQVLQGPVRQPDLADQRAQDHKAPKAPGMKYAHYAPNGELILVGNGGPEVHTLQSHVNADRAKGLRVGILATEETANRYDADAVLACGKRTDLQTVAERLYDTLRQFDQENVDRIYAETFPLEGIGYAIMNRLSKAAAGRRIT